VPDPFGLSWKAQREIAREIRELSLELAQHLFGVAGSELLLPVPEKIRRRPRWAWRLGATPDSQTDKGVQRSGSSVLAS